MAKIPTAPTLPKARNAIKRALRELIDPSPTIEEADELWRHFQSRCLYCGAILGREEREAHLDHLDSSHAGGASAIGNRVLACGGCNGDNKRETPWREFLEKKCPDEAERARRLTLIMTWQRDHPVPSVIGSLEDVWEKACANALSAFDEAAEEIRTNAAQEYLVRGADPARAAVEVWSSTRLPFEPRGWLRDMRERIRGALRGLPAAGDRGLDAVYMSGEAGLFDVENVLLYNVGAGALGHVARRGVRFRRERGAMPPRPDGRPARHYQRYGLVDPRTEGQKGERLASFRFRLDHLNSDTEAHEVWWALVNGQVTVARPGVYEGRFGLQVHLASRRECNLSGILKPLFDGIICGFQADIGGTDPLVVERLSRALAQDAARIQAGLIAGTRGLLRGERLVTAYRDFVKWNPVDHRCEAGSVSRTSHEERHWDVTGEVVALPPLT